MDANRDGDFNDAGENIYTVTSNAQGIPSNSISYNTSSLTQGYYATKVDVTDMVTGRIDTAEGGFTVITVGGQQPTIQTWQLNGLDSIDQDGVFGGADSHSTNLITAGTTNFITLTAGVTNSSNNSLNYTFMIDSDNDGNYENIQPGLDSSSSSGERAVYSISSLKEGTYNTKVIVVDRNGLSQERISQFSILSPVWSANGFDSTDSDGVFGGFDSNITNNLSLGTAQTVMTAGVNNPNNAALNYKFYVDSNNDGIFELVGDQRSTSSSGTSYALNVLRYSVGTYNTRVTISDINGDSVDLFGSFRINPPTGINFDVSDNDRVFGGADSHPTNTIVAGSLNNLVMIASTTGANGAPLTYQFQIDSNNDGVFENINSQFSSSGGVYAYYNPANLTPGTYDFKLSLRNSDGSLISEVLDTLTVTQPTFNWSVSGLDSDDFDRTYGGADSNRFDTVGTGTGYITLVAAVDNASGARLTYQFQIDSNNDGVFEDIGTSLSSGTDAFIHYDSASLGTGSYVTQVIISDNRGYSQTVRDSITIVNPTIASNLRGWSAIGLDSVDSSGGYGGTDSNASNIINEASTGNSQMIAGVENSARQTLTYQFSIDLNKDGDYLDAGEAFYRTTTSDAAGASAIYSTSGLALGSYNTKVDITDINGFTSSKVSSFTIQAKSWSLNNLDSVNANPNDVIAQGLQSIQMVANVTNSSTANLSYEFFIDSDKNGIFESLGKFTNDSSTAASFFYDPSRLTVGTYDTRVTVTDINGLSSTVNDSFTVLAPTLTAFNADDLDGVINGVDSNPSNSLSAGDELVRMVAAVSNSGKANLTYTFAVDLNNDGDFIDAGEQLGVVSSTSSTGIYFDYHDVAFPSGTFTTNVRVTDVTGATVGSLNDQITVDSWTLNSVDSIFERTYLSDTTSYNSWYTNNFFTPATSTIVGQTVLGGNSIFGTGSFAEKLLADLPKGEYEISFVFYHIDQWAGQKGQLIFNGQEVWSRVHTNSGLQALGSSTYGDTSGLAYGVATVKVNHEGGDALMRFTSNLVGSTGSWGVANVIVKAEASLSDSSSSISNTISSGEDSVNYYAEVSNPQNLPLTYTYQIDANKDGDFLDIGETLAAVNSTESVILQYDASKLTAGTYNTKVTVSDGLNNTQFKTDSLAVKNWQISQFDSADNDGLANNLDGNSANVVSGSARMVAGVSNFAEGAGLTYKYYVDLNKDSDFNDAGELVYQTITDQSEIVFDYDVSKLSSGSYNTKLDITDSNNQTQSSLSQFMLQDGRLWGSMPLIVTEPSEG